MGMQLQIRMRKWMRKWMRTRDRNEVGRGIGPIDRRTCWGLGSLVVAVCAIALAEPSAALPRILDLRVAGDGELTRDDATGLDWLDLGVTRGLSVEEVLAGTYDSWIAEGWRFATEAEVCQLVEDFGIETTACPGSTTLPDGGVAKPFTDALGGFVLPFKPPPGPGDPRTTHAWGFYDDGDLFSFAGVAKVKSAFDPDDPPPYASGLVQVAPDAAAVDQRNPLLWPTGSYLVRDAPAGAPPAWPAWPEPGASQRVPDVSDVGPHWYEGGATFRVWAPHSERVAVVDLTAIRKAVADGLLPADFSISYDLLTADPEHLGWTSYLTLEPGGTWSADIDGVQVGDEYRFITGRSGDGHFPVTRRDPRGRKVTTSDNHEGDTILTNPEEFNWSDDAWSPAMRPAANELSIYEINVGSFNDEPGLPVGDFESAKRRLHHIANLGFRAVQVLPIAEFPSEDHRGLLQNNGYAVSDPYAVENGSYGGDEAYKSFVKEAHRLGLAVIQDVVYASWTYGDGHLHRFDGWADPDHSNGIYYLDDARAPFQFGNRGDFTRPEVRDFILDNVRMWIDEYHVDGFRFDNVQSIYTYEILPGVRVQIPEGLQVVQEANDLIDTYPGIWTVGEVIWDVLLPTRPTAQGGMGFTTQWKGRILNTAQLEASDADRSVAAVADAVTRKWNLAPFSALSFTQSHDYPRPAFVIDPEAPAGFRARKLSSLLATIAFTSVGVPMLFQGEEFVSTQEATGTTTPIDWSERDTYRGNVEYYADLVRLRRGTAGVSAGLRGDHVDPYYQLDSTTGGIQKVLAYHRWDAGGPGDDVVVVANFGPDPLVGHAIGLPHPGRWEVRLNGDASRYGTVCDPTCSSDYTDVGPSSVVADGPALHGMAQSALFDVGPYSALILSQSCAASDDQDLDGACDGFDNCAAVANEGQQDADRDGFGNACDADLDDDGVVSLADLGAVLTCLGRAVPGAGPESDPYCRESDLDSDGEVGSDDLGTVQSLLGTLAGPSGLSCSGTKPCVAAQGDLDGDAIPNGQDNCLLVENFVQDDGDEDGFGNACDCDFNNDGICGGADNLTFLFDWCVHNPTFVGADYCAAHPSYDGLMCNLDCTLQTWPTEPTGRPTDMNGDGFYTVEDGDLYNALTHLANGDLIVGEPGPSGSP